MITKFATDTNGGCGEGKCVIMLTFDFVSVALFGQHT